MEYMGKRQRHREREELLERVADSYWAHRDSWAPTEGVAADLGINVEKASGLVAQARTRGVLEMRRPRRLR